MLQRAPRTAVLASQMLELTEPKPEHRFWLTDVKPPSILIWFGACGIGELVNGPHDICVAAFNPLTDSGYLCALMSSNLRRGNRLGFYGSRSALLLPHRPLPPNMGERPHLDEVHKRIVPISVVLSLLRPESTEDTGNGKHIGLVPYIFVLSFYLVFVLLNCDAPENHRKFSGFPALAGGNYPTIGGK